MFIDPVELCLELVEAARRSSVQNVGSVSVGIINGPLTSALKSRMTRQEGAINHVDAHFFSCVTQDEAEGFLTLAERSEVFAFRRLAIRGAIGEGGWAALAEALRVLPPLLLDVAMQCQILT